jgi:catechol 2,3-dioxygenase-like lactoylglutathione lyase family enzyme
MIDHTGVVVSNFENSKAFYMAALKPIGYQKLQEFSAPNGGVEVAGFGESSKADFWINTGTPNKPPIHIAFRATTRALVDEFYRAALAAGGRDNGGPGVRAHYHANYYGAFVLDPDGHNIEVVCHEPS